MGIAGGLYLTLCNVSIQSRPPDRLRGRLVGVWGTVWGVAPFAYLATGAGADEWGVARVLLLCGLICAGACGVARLSGSQLRAL